MTLLPLTDCCLLLGIDPKTLRLWLKAAHLSWSVHPSDARLKCLTQPQLAHLAHLHGRSLPSPLPQAFSPAASLPTSAPVLATAESPAALACSPSGEVELRHTLARLQTAVATLQEQVTHLALALLRERDWHGQARLSSAQAAVPLPATNTLVAGPTPSHPDPSRLPVTDPAPKPAAAPSAPSRPRARSRALPLIEYGADGRYVVICPTQGMLSLVPDSPAWFDWLASLTAFTFVGATGRFSTTRKVRQGQRVQAWSAYRSLHGRSCYLYLGLTSHLTVARLEEMAATIHARLTIF